MTNIHLNDYRQTNDTEDSSRDSTACLAVKTWVFTFDFWHGGKLVLKLVAEWLWASWFEVAGVVAPTGGVEAALAHTRVVPEPALVQVGVGQRVAGRYTLVLGSNNRYIQQVHSTGTFNTFLNTMATF